MRNCLLFLARLFQVICLLLFIMLLTLPILVKPENIFAFIDTMRGAKLSSLCRGSTALQQLNWREDNICDDKHTLIPPNRDGELGEHAVFAAKQFNCSEKEVTEICQRTGLKPIENRSDSEVALACRPVQTMAKQFTLGDKKIIAFKITGSPEQLKLKTGRRFEHILLLHNLQTHETSMQLGYGTLQAAKKAQDDFENSLKPSAAQTDLIRKARTGDADSEFQIAEFYRDKRTGVNSAVPYECLEWYEKAAKQGHLQAQYQLGVLLSGGALGYWDHDQAKKWLTQAAEHGHVAAQSTLGSLLIATDKKEAGRWTLSAAKNGDVDAMRMMGDNPYGWNTTEPPSYWYKRAIAAGDRYSALRLAQIYGAENNLDEAIKVLKPVANWYDAQMYLGDLYERHNDHKNAVVYFKAAADSQIDPPYSLIDQLFSDAAKSRQNLYKEATESAGKGDLGRAAKFFRSCAEVRQQDWAQRYSF